MMIALISLVIIWLIPMIVYIIWKRGDWYLFLFPLFISILICMGLSMISDTLSISFVIIVVIYFVYNLTNKKARRINCQIKKQRDEIYKEYKKNEVDNQAKYKDYILPSGSKVEYIDFNTKTFYILRPYVENIDIKYERILQKNLKELREVYGGEWDYVIDTF